MASNNYQPGDYIFCNDAAGYSGKARVVTVDSDGKPTVIERGDGKGWVRASHSALIPRSYKPQYHDTYWSVKGEDISNFSRNPFASSTSAQATANALLKAMKQINNNQSMAMPNSGGPIFTTSGILSGPISGGASFSNSSIHYLFGDAHGNQQALVTGIPVVLLSGRGHADPSKDSNPLWNKTGLEGRVRHISQTSGGYAEVHIEWENGLGNVYTLGNGSCEIQFRPFAPPFSPKMKFKIKEEALDALILEASVKREILAVLKQHENRDKLFDDWGLGETIEYGRGMSMMFWGGPGTGKTWGAHCIAKALSTELLIISAAEIQSSEPGAAERNIQEAFKAAKEENKVLFIDECDSLITTRADLGLVLAATVNCLLTEIEKFEGVCILATNRIETMDEALERRLALIIEFPFPKYAQRIDIWKKLLPSKLPLAADITPETLAQPKFTGGLIKNIILQAARLALADGAEVVSKENFDAAIERVNKSKGIMGNVARTRTGRPHQDVGVVMGISNNPQIGRKVDIDTFLEEDKDEKDKEKES